MNLSLGDAAPKRQRTRRRDDDHGDVWWECTKGCAAFFRTPQARDAHEVTCAPDVWPWTETTREV